MPQQAAVAIAAGNMSAESEYVHLKNSRLSVAPLSVTRYQGLFIRSNLSISTYASWSATSSSPTFARQILTNSRLTTKAAELVQSLGWGPNGIAPMGTELSPLSTESFVSALSSNSSPTFASTYFPITASLNTLAIQLPTSNAERPPYQQMLLLQHILQ